MTTRKPKSTREGWQVSDITAEDMDEFAVKEEGEGRVVIARLARYAVESMRLGTWREMLKAKTDWAVGWTDG